MIKQKFQEVALLVSNGFYSQSIDECFNGENIVSSLNADLENLIGSYCKDRMRQWPSLTNSSQFF